MLERVSEFTLEPEQDYTRKEFVREDTVVLVREEVPGKLECLPPSCGCVDKELWEDFLENIEDKEKLISINIMLFILPVKVTNIRTRASSLKLFKQIKRKN